MVKMSKSVRVDIVEGDVSSKNKYGTAQLRIAEGPYAGVVFQIGAVSFPELNEKSAGDFVPPADGDLVPFHIEFDVIEVPEAMNTTIEVIEKDEDFHQILGDIIIDSISQMLEEQGDGEIAERAIPVQ